MLVQDWLRDDCETPIKALDNLKNHLGIKHTIHDDGRVILNYDQFESIKTNPIVQECRGLVLDMNNNWNIVARSFSRFFNLGECLEEQAKFHWDDCFCTDKEDGSLLIIYYWKGQWCMNTRGSFGEGQVGDFPITWHGLVDMAMPSKWRDRLNTDLVYVCELCSRYNKVVRDYPEPKIYLLSCFDGDFELEWYNVNDIADTVGIDCPEMSYLSSPDEIVEYVKREANDDKTFEGVVVRDFDNNRIKIKSDDYLLLHRLANNGALCSVKSLVPILLSGEEDEIIAYFPEIAEYCAKLKVKIDETFEEVDNLWFCHHDEKNRKRFAGAILQHPMSWALFQAKDKGGHPNDYIRKFPEKLVKVLEKK